MSTTTLAPDDFLLLDLNDTANNGSNSTVPTSPEIRMGRDDAAWILANAFLVLTMQTGFGMLEAGTVSEKNIANIMIKNVVDVSIGGITYWAIGYGLSFGEYGNAFCGWGNFFAHAKDTDSTGEFYTHYVFQFSFATAATTIVSGAVAERMKFGAYMIYSSLNVFIYCIPASWAWSKVGFLGQEKFFDFAGAAVVHLNGGASALVAAYMLGPRIGRFKEGVGHNMSSPVTALTGCFMLWWAWLAFNCGSSFGISGDMWKVAAKVGVTTLNGSIGGSLIGLLLSAILTYKEGHYHYDVSYVIESVLGGLIGVTACCSVIEPFEALVIGMIELMFPGGIVAVLMCPVMEKLKIDDPVGAVPVHMFAAMWSTLAVGLFGKNDFDLLGGNEGLLHGGGLKLLGIQIAGMLAITTWSMGCTWLVLFGLKSTIGIRMDEEEELLGADWVEHRIAAANFASRLEHLLSSLQMDQHQADVLIAKVLVELKSGDRSQVAAGLRNFGGKKEVEQDNIRAIAQRRKTVDLGPLQKASTTSRPFDESEAYGEETEEQKKVAVHRVFSLLQEQEVQNEATEVRKDSAGTEKRKRSQSERSTVGKRVLSRTLTPNMPPANGVKYSHSPAALENKRSFVPSRKHTKHSVSPVRAASAGIPEEKIEQIRF